MTSLDVACGFGGNVNVSIFGRPNLPVKEVAGPVSKLLRELDRHLLLIDLDRFHKI